MDNKYILLLGLNDNMEPTIKPINYERMGYVLQDYCRRLSDYEAPVLKEKMLLDEMIDESTYSQAFLELKKYFALIRFSGKPLAMTSRVVDEVWHQFILFTREYHEFSNEFYGQYIHHVPNVPSRPGSPVALENFIAEYEATFGELPEIWNVRVKK